MIIQVCLQPTHCNTPQLVIQTRDTGTTRICKRNLKSQKRRHESQQNCTCDTTTVIGTVHRTMPLIFTTLLKCLRHIAEFAPLRLRLNKHLLVGQSASYHASSPPALANLEKPHRLQAQHTKFPPNTRIRHGLTIKLYTH